MKHINISLDSGEIRRNVPIDAPNECPTCHYAIDPIFCYAYCNRDKWQSDRCGQVVFRCTRNACSGLFFAYYKAGDSLCNHLKLSGVGPCIKKKKSFSEEVHKISDDFCSIYDEAFCAEQDGLMQICGAGYRKALEFLIKDYLIARLPENESAIMGAALGNCIEYEVVDARVKLTAKRAAWLGNDEVHYVRQWGDKDIVDLKGLIDLVLHWIEMERLTEEALSQMPDKKTSV